MSSAAYKIVIRQLSDAEGGGFVASAPDLQGCHGDGETQQEALADVLAAIEEWKDEALRLGRPIPAPGYASDRARKEAREIVDGIDKQHKLVKRQESLIKKQEALIKDQQELLAAKETSAQLLVKVSGSMKSDSLVLSGHVFDWVDADLDAVNFPVVIHQHSKKVRFLES